MFGRIKLHSFIRCQPKHSGNIKASRALLETFEDRLPSELLELWKKHGFGFYGKQQFQLIAPTLWQDTLDRWIVTSVDAIERIPIALTPFGTILFYRKLSATDEDIATLDPVYRSSEILTYNLVEFFNNFMCNKESSDNLLRSDLIKTASQEAGLLTIGESYQIDLTLLQMELIRINKIDAFQLHKTLRDAVDTPNAPALAKPANLKTAIPIEYLSDFIGTESNTDRLSGLYLSSYINWYKLIRLNDDNSYILLYWEINKKTGERKEIRSYTGNYTLYQTEDKDQFIKLDIEMRDDSLGSDEDDSELFVIHHKDETMLLITYAIDDVATSIGSYGTMGPTNEYYTNRKLTDPIPKYFSNGIDALPMETLPIALQQLIHTEPLEMNIIEVGNEESHDDTTVMVKVNIGEDHGLRMNMPVWSAKNSSRNLHGWVWDIDAKNCGVGIDVEREDSGEIINKPQVGDVLVTTKPE